MAGDWLKMDHNTPEKPEVLEITRRMGWDDADMTVGKLFRVWRWFDQHTIDGNAHSVTFALLDRIANVEGFSHAMHAVGWLQTLRGCLTLPKFERHNGATAKSRALTVKRVASFRASHRASDPPVEPAANPVTLAALPKRHTTVTETTPREEEEKKSSSSSARRARARPSEAPGPLHPPPAPAARAGLRVAWREAAKAARADLDLEALELAYAKFLAWGAKQTHFAPTLGDWLGWVQRERVPAAPPAAEPGTERTRPGDDRTEAGVRALAADLGLPVLPSDGWLDADTYIPFATYAALVRQARDADAEGSRDYFRDAVRDYRRRAPATQTEHAP
jgi:hypothetical protein